ncbi:hypothetical protein E2493_19635 [Sphingomonas parva]|uniref:Uncharacterized protein n=1 Tax=Sphingomonas parva TaxID=2555898 RepID=A0A4Y8ZMQ9_9SPHN|nr:hypothetical protein [Sphingomonas parva]TFI56552.1 hypothetical protein E2493_19635 [Sphingomonas parva]
MKASELQDLLITSLVRTRGGTRRQWRIAIGPVKVRDRATHPHCNWSVSPSGSAAEISAIERLLDDVRLSQPFVTAG